MAKCPCGLQPSCPYGQKPGEVLNCPLWEDHVKPSLWERITGTVIALLPWRW